MKSRNCILTATALALALQQSTRLALADTLYWDGTIRLEVGVELLGALTDQDEVVHSATPAGPVASATNLGPYNTLGAAHDAIHQWCKANDKTLAGPSWEIYGHWLPEWNNNPSQIRTDVYYLLAS